MKYTYNNDIHFSDKIMLTQATLIAAAVVLMYGKICTAYSVPYIMPGLNITKNGCARKK